MKYGFPNDLKMYNYVNVKWRKTNINLHKLKMAVINYLEFLKIWLRSTHDQAHTFCHDTFLGRLSMMLVILPQEEGGQWAWLLSTRSNSTTNNALLKGYKSNIYIYTCTLHIMSYYF